MNPQPKSQSKSTDTATTINVRSQDTDCRNRAANALKHGFSAARFMKPETLELADSIRDELTQIHQPDSRGEIDLIAELALAKAQFLEIEKARQIRIAQERASAADRFDRTCADALDRDKSAWRQDPAGRVWPLSSTYPGAKFLAELWFTVLEELRAGLTLPFDTVCDAVMALGSHWQVDKAEGEGLLWMTWYVRTAPDPAVAAELWAKESKSRDGLEFARDRVARRMTEAPSAADARREMESLANREMAEWKSIARQLHPAHESSRELAPHCSVGLGTGDSNLEKELRLLHRYATSARNHADRLQRRLDSLIRNRAIEARRAARELRPDTSANQPAKPCRNATCGNISKRSSPRMTAPATSMAVASVANQTEPGEPETTTNEPLANNAQTIEAKPVATPLRNGSAKVGQHPGMPVQGSQPPADDLAMTSPMDRIMTALQAMSGFVPK